MLAFSGIFTVAVQVTLCGWDPPGAITRTP
jgi:hypothetical protein